MVSNSWDHLQLCICASRWPCLVMGHFCSVNAYKPRLKSPCGDVMALLWMCPLGHPGGNTACLPCSASPERLRPSAAPGPLVFCQLPTCALPHLGSANGANSRTSGCGWSDFMTLSWWRAFPDCGLSSTCDGRRRLIQMSAREGLRLSLLVLKMERKGHKLSPRMHTASRS